jgi:arsenite oxidase small subunit
VSNPPEDELVDIASGRRDFLKLTLAAAVIVTSAAVGSFLRFLRFIPSPTISGTAEVNANLVHLSWPRIKLVNAKTLIPLQPVNFNYPLVNTPNTLVKLGAKADDGIGPDGDIVAYSSICQHLGCYFAFQSAGSTPLCDPSYKVPTAEGYCCCHGGEYDLQHGGKVIGGPPPRAVPRVFLEYDNSTGDIYATGMSGPTIFGHGPPGTTDPASVLSYDLQGGEIVTSATVFSE